MAVYEPPNNYFNNINFNTDFYQVPNDELNGISAAYANSHYLQISQGTKPKSQAISSIFAGTISENNILLSTKYQSNLYASINYLSKQYPPISLTVYGANTISGQTYGNGSYNVTNSSALGGYEANYAFNYPYTPNTVVWMSGNAYTVSTGVYNGGTSTTVLNPISSNVAGEWLQLQIPSALVLKNYIITGISGGGNVRCPISWILAGSINGSTWYELDNRSGITWASGSNQAYSLSLNNITYNTTAYNYYRIIPTQTGGGAWASFNQLLFNFYDPADASFAAISTGGIGIGTNSLPNPMTLYNSGTSRLNGYVGINTNPSTLYGLDVKSFSGVRVQHETAGNGMAVLGPASNPTSCGVVYLYNGTPSICGWVGSGGYSIPNYLDLIATSTYLGWHTNANFFIAGNCGVGTTTLSTNAAFDVGGTATTTKYSFLNGLRISGRDANTIWQNITTSNINITTSGASQNIGFNIGNGTNVGTFNSSGLQLPLTKGIGVGTAAPAYSGVDVFGVSSPLVSISGSNCRIGLNADNIRLAYVTNAGVYSTGSLANDFVVLNINGRILFNPNSAPYAHCIMSTSGLGATTFHSTATGAQGAIITGSGAITCTSIAADGATVKNSLSLTGGTPSTLSSPINASAGTQVSNYVTVAPYGYILWGGGNNSGVVAFSANTGTQYSIRADYAIIGGGFISYSDKRIKRDIKPIENSLDIIEKIEPKNYNIIETAENRYGFIAQEVEEVIPNAVNLAHDFIPNIFDYGTYDDKIITFDNKNNLDIVEGDEVKINYESCRVEEVIDKNTFKIHKKLEVDETKKVFIMGTKVKDFKCMNYDMITSINTAAIKELYSIIKQQQEQIAFLLTKLS